MKALDENGTQLLIDQTKDWSYHTVELTNAEYQALVAAGTVDPKVAYYITDAYPEGVGVLKKNGIQYGNGGGGGGTANVDELTAAQIQEIKDAFEDAMPSGPFNYEVAESLTHDQMEDIKSYIDGITPSPFPSMQYKYSTSEVVVGEWIDGSKIYQKTYEVIGAGGANQIVDSAFPGTKLIDMKCTDQEGSSLNGATYTGITSSNTLTMFMTPTSWSFNTGVTYYLTVQYIK